ncbi:hypothetical protein LNP05_08650 [Klebsiella pneumoniae subsp. pneumoniae]|nr:hypothetical protein [Klebsiella pneumoniae subsp. pneumoniae]
MGHKFITACGCGVVKKMEKYRAPLSGTIQRPLPVNSARYAPEAAWERIVFWYYHAKAVCHRLRRRNLNAYNVLKQGTIAKADDYAGYVFHTSIIYHIDRKPVAYHANKKAARAH